MAWRTLDLRDDPDEARFEGDPADLVDAAGFLMALLDRPAWHADAACRGHGHERWFAVGAKSAEALAVCQSCPVRRECHQAALEQGPDAWVTSLRETAPDISPGAAASVVATPERGSARL